MQKVIVKDLRIANAILKKMVQNENQNLEDYAFDGYYKYLCHSPANNWLSEIEYKGKKYKFEYFGGCFYPFLCELKPIDVFIYETIDKQFQYLVSIRGIRDAKIVELNTITKDWLFTNLTQLEFSQLVKASDYTFANEKRDSLQIYGYRFKIAN